MTDNCISIQCRCTAPLTNRFKVLTTVTMPHTVPISALCLFSHDAKTISWLARTCRTGISMFVADRTGLEPATSGVTGRHSNQLNYRSTVVISRYKWWVMTGSNRRPSACKADALPAELITPEPRTRIIEILACCQTFAEKFRKNTAIKSY